MKIRKGDTIKIIAGKDRGKTGKVLRVFPSKLELLAEGVNMKKKHVRPRQQGKRGQVVEIPAPFSASNAMVVCLSCGKPARVGHNVREGKKQRTCKKCKASW